jgi:hypothetical protein
MAPGLFYQVECGKVKPAVMNRAGMGIDNNFPEDEVFVKYGNSEN